MVIYQPKRGYCYNSDTIFLYDFISRFPLKGEVLDVGTGSGILALLVARDFERAKVSAIEIQEHFVQFAKINSVVNKKNITIYFGDFLYMEFEKRFDFLIANPPFYHHNVLRSKNEMVDTARHCSHLPFSKFLQKANRILKPRGGILFCYDAKQIQDIIYQLKWYKFTIEKMRFVHPYRNRAASLVMVYAKKSSKSLAQIMEPLIVFKENGEYQESVKKIFERVGVHSIKCEM